MFPLLLQAHQYKILVEIRSKELELEKLKFSSIQGRVESKKKEYEKLQFVAMVENYLVLFLEVEIKKQWQVLYDAGEITEEWEEIREVGNCSLFVFASNSGF